MLARDGLWLAKRYANLSYMFAMDYDDPRNGQCNELVDFLQNTEVWNQFQTMSTVRVLELGCGTGPFGRRLLAEHPSVTVVGVEILPERMDKLNRLLKESGLSGRYQVVLGDILDPALFSPGSFDVILASSVLHHIERLHQSALPGNIQRWLRPGGFLLILDPNGANPVLQISNQVMRLAVRVFKALRPYKWPGETMYTPTYYRRTFCGIGLLPIKSCVVNPWFPVRDTGSNLLGLRNRLNNLMAHLTWGDWHGGGQMCIFQRQ
jgi:SAM-dependent methyltransferase